jgi:LmbE family N-acetylglucosaminyl deacetylase
VTGVSTDLHPDLATDLDPEDQAAPEERSAALAVPRRALAVGAHPDDIEFGAGGTLARWLREGCHVTMLVITDGSKGTWDPAVDPAVLVETRRAEQRAAAVALGGADVVHLDHVDGELEATMALREELCRWIRVVVPDVVLGHDPWMRYQLHPDHRAAGIGLVDGVVAARDHLFFPDQGVPAHRPDSLLLWAADVPDHYEPVADTIEAKISALLCHTSQGTTTMGGADQDEHRRTEFADRVRARAIQVGQPVGMEMAESFKRLVP